MKIEALHVGMKVRHPQYGVGSVRTINEHAAEVCFSDGQKTVDPVTAGLEPADANVVVSGLTQPLARLIEDTVTATVSALGLERPESVRDELLARWHDGRMVLHSADPALQTKEVPLEVFFHKLVMVRNNLRVLEQKVNAHEKLTEAEKVEMQQYITRSYGSLTTFNILFRHKDGQFNTKE